MELRKLVHRMVSSQSKIKTKIRENNTMLMSFSDVSAFFVFPSIDVKFGEVPVPDLIRGPGSENDNIVVIIFVGFLFL